MNKNSDNEIVIKTRRKACLVGLADVFSAGMPLFEECTFVAVERIKNKAAWIFHGRWSSKKSVDFIHSETWGGICCCASFSNV